MQRLYRRQSSDASMGTSRNVLTARVYFLAIVISGAPSFSGMIWLSSKLLLSRIPLKDFGLEHISKSAEDAFAANIVSLYL
ncbi:hypothetical protein BBP40_002642 [Aspergillus hancockii]|nr:hypothetical protein BBP40_002642 [Aspergillus hancockii]